MDEYQRRKQIRREEYAKNNGRGWITCVACNGSGRYDNTGSPPCSACGGKGKVRATND
jgi:DnaJ-class molecular chaperone